MNKYKNKKTIVNGIVFDSKLEARRYTELLLLQKTNKIKDLQLQPSFELIPSFKKNGRTFRKTTYKADFLYIDTETGQKIVEDTKRILDRTLQTKEETFWIYLQRFTNKRNKIKGGGKEMQKSKKKYSINIYNDNLKTAIIMIAKKKNTTTTKYIEDTLKEQVAKDKQLLTNEELLSMLNI